MEEHERVRPPVKDDSSPQSLLKRIFSRYCSWLGLVDVIVAIPCVLTITGHLGGIWWAFDLTSHFICQYVITQLVGAGIYLILRRWKRALAVAPFIMVNAALIVPLWIPPSDGLCDLGEGAQVRILMMNVHSANRQHDLVKAYIDETRPDVVMLEETTVQWLTAVTGALEGFPYRVEEPRPDNFGIALYSKLPLENGRTWYVGKARLPSIIATMRTTAGRVTLLGTHPLPPVGERGSGFRNEQIDAIARARGELGERLIIVGDLNTTSWSVHFRDFIDRMGLVDSRRGFGVQPTWPTGLPFLWIPIDHCLVSPDIVVTNRRVGPAVGSDHYPVVVDLWIPTVK